MKKNAIIFLIITLLTFSCSNTKQDIESAKTSFKNKDYENALLDINKVIDSQPDSISHYIFRGMVYDLLGKYNEELLDINTIIELNKKRNNSSKSLKLYQQRAYVLFKIGKHEEALNDINYFIKNRDTVGSLADAYTDKATILYSIGDFKNSKKFYELSIINSTVKEDTIKSQALVGLANLEKSDKNAFILLDKALLIHKKNWIAYGAKAERYLSLGQSNEAYRNARKAMKINSNDQAINFNMGQLFATYLNNIDSAKFYYEKAINVSPQSTNNDNIYMNLAVLKHKTGDLESALDDFKNGEKVNPKNDLLLYNQAILLSDMNNQKEALDKISEAIKLNNKDAGYYNLKGAILINMSLLNEASKEFFTAIKLEPNLGQAFYNLGYLYGEQDNYMQSIKYYNEAVKLKFDLKATLVNLALQKIKINESPCDDLKMAYKIGRNDILPTINKYCN